MRKAWIFILIMMMGGDLSARERTLKNMENPEAPLEESDKISDKLSMAVCDEMAVSQAPSLADTEETLRELKKLKVRSGFYRFKASLSEPEIIRFLLGDDLIHLDSPALEALLKEKKTYASARRQLALDICIAFLTPQRMSQIRKQPEQVLFPLQTETILDLKGIGVRTTPGFWILKDVQKRTGLVSEKWWIAGWIEPFEVYAVRTGSRSYQRLIQPMTQSTLFLVQLDPNGIPAGFFYLTRDSHLLGIRELQAQSRSSVVRQKTQDVYKAFLDQWFLVVSEIYPDQSEEIKQIQDEYRNAILLSDSDPVNPVVKKYRDEQPPPRVLDHDWLQMLQKIRYKGNQYVGFQPLTEDPVLYGIVRETLRKITALTRK